MAGACLGPVPAVGNVLRINGLRVGARPVLNFQAAQSGKAPADQPQESPPASATAGDQPQPLSLQDVVVRDVLEPLQIGLTTSNLKQVWSLFDPEATSSFPEVRDQFRALLTNYTELQFRYKLLQLTADKDHASAICEVDMDAAPLDDTLLPVRRSTQMRFQLKHTASGWKIAAFSPADFFAQ